MRRLTILFASARLPAGVSAVLLGIFPAASLAASVSVIYGFPTPKRGSFPSAPLAKLGQTLYGTTSLGGAYKNGAIFSLRPDGTYKTLHSFAGGSDGSLPNSDGLINVGGTLYGATQYGGGNGCGGSGCGTVFSIQPSGAYVTLYAFKGGSDGANPAANLVLVGSTLYGTTTSGGGGGCSGNGCGTVFTITSQGSETVVHSFQGDPDGAEPGSLISAGGTLYGTTKYGGVTAGCSCGTVFALTPQGNETVLYAFPSYTDGAYPNSPLVKHGEWLYGTTLFGGKANAGRCTMYGCGTAFRVNLSGRHHIMYSFADGADGGFPSAGLALLNKTFYGTANEGGTSDKGTVFSMDMTGNITTLHSFTGGDFPGGDGNSPAATLTVFEGLLYGSTMYGGYSGSSYCPAHSGCGTIFRVTP